MDAYLENLVSSERLPNARRLESQTNGGAIEASLTKLQKILSH